MPVSVCQPILKKMIEHARLEYPLECCGFLSGCRQLADTITPATNEKKSRHEFFIPPRELFGFFRELRRSSKDLIGIYHSHPQSEAMPSPRDISDFHYPEAGYWIISLKNREPDIRCFQWVRMGFEEVAYTVIHRSIKDVQR